MPTVDLVDETFIAAPPAEVAAVVADPQRWRAWWPDLRLQVFMDRGLSGIRWSIQGALVGSAEIWLEPFGDGVILHHYLRAEPTLPGSATQARPAPQDPAGWRRAAKLRAARVKRWKRDVWQLKDALEGDRRPGDAAVAPGAACRTDRDPASGATPPG